MQESLQVVLPMFGSSQGWQYRQVPFYARVTFQKNVVQVEIVKIEHKTPI
jgi:hypothetical protein